MREALQLAPGPVVLAGYPTDARPLAPLDKSGKMRELISEPDLLSGLQERFYAEASAGSSRNLLLVLQGMDTSGKGGVTNHVVGVFEPIGVHYTAFKKPTDEEAAHDFLWRIRRAVPGPGIIGVFDRSHYEDVLVPRVHETIDADELERRYGAINDFEAELTAGGTTVVKCFLHISFDEQRKRLLARLDDPTKRWKFNEGDITERAHWSDYVTAYEALLERCNTPDAPWFIVPSDSKKYRNWAIAEILKETLQELDPHYPDPKLDVEALRAGLQPPH
jgi:PPK2 family polyphosphate:nucleotide phosphotransferase